MIKNNKGRIGGDRDATLISSYGFNDTQIASLNECRGADEKGWRVALAMGNGYFRIKGIYTAIASTRAIKRRLNRLAKQRGRT